MLRWYWLIGVVLLVFAGTYAPDRLRVGDFSAQDPSQATPDGWTPISFADIDTRTQ